MSFRQKANNIILTAFSVIFIAFSLRPAVLPYRYGHIVPRLPLPEAMVALAEHHPGLVLGVTDGPQEAWLLTPGRKAPPLSPSLPPNPW